MKRRSVYFFVKRSQLAPMMTLFDAPDGTVGIEARTNTTIAPQALLLMNSPVVRSASPAFAARLAGLKDDGGGAAGLRAGRRARADDGRNWRDVGGVPARAAGVVRGGEEGRTRRRWRWRTSARCCWG